jgi:hypothetical protein
VNAAGVATGFSRARRGDVGVRRGSGWIQPGGKGGWILPARFNLGVQVAQVKGGKRGPARAPTDLERGGAAELEGEEQGGGEKERGEGA